MTTTTTEISVEIGARINDLMWRKRISQTKAGAAIGVGQSTFGKKLRGEVGISVVELVLLAGLLEVDPAELLPRLDSNQRPFGYQSPQVRAGVAWGLAA